MRLEDRPDHHVIVTGALMNGHRFHYEWSSRVHFGRLLGKGARWAREELRKEKVPGRSRMRWILVRVGVKP